MRSNGSNPNTGNSSRNKRRRLPLAGLAAMLLIAAGVSGCGNGGEAKGGAGHALIAARLESIRQEGQPVTLEELNAWYPEPAAGENAAALYAQAFAALPAGDAKVGADLAHGQQALTLLHQAAAKSQCRYPVDLAQFPTTMPHLPKIKAGCQLLDREALADTGKGHPEQAAQSLLDALCLARSLQQEPLRGSQLFRMAADATTVAALESALSQRAFPEDRLQQLQAGLREESHALWEAFPRPLVADRCNVLRLYQMTPQEYENVCGPLGTNAPFGAPAEREKYRRSAAFDADLGRCLDYFSNALALASLPFPACLDAASQGAPDENAPAGDAGSKGSRLCAQFALDLRHALERTAEATAQLRAAETALAVERYRAANGQALPASLAELEPRYLATVPEDPFDGKPLRFHRLSPKGFVVYSIGRDRQDDGGKPKPAVKTDGGYDVTFIVKR
jgi:hypothetical protein